MGASVGFASLRGVRVVLLSSGIAAASVGCKTRGLHESATKQTEPLSDLVPYHDFCESASGSNTKPEGEVTQFWDRRTIESEIDKWHKMVVADPEAPELKEIFTDDRPLDASPRFRASSVLVSYATAYKQMTAERDKARCDRTSSMRSDNALVNMINHALADLMTRNIVNISKQCLLRGAESGGYGVEPLNGRWEFCDLYFDAAGPSRRYTNSMTIAMSSTMIYLTSHISAALSALPFMDRLWIGTEFERRVNDSQWEERIEFIARNYGPAYNAFNKFLSVNLDTVSQALYKDSKDTSDKYALLRGPELKDISRAIENDFPTFTALIAHIFATIRNESFNLGLEIAKNIAKSKAARDSLAEIFKTGNPLPEIHPFLVARPMKNQSSIYYDIREEPPLFDERLLEFPSVINARLMTWKHRFLVESFTASTFFRSLGAISYAQGFNDSRRSEGKIIAKIVSCAMGLAGGFSRTFRAELENRQNAGLQANFERKLAAAGLDNQAVHWRSGQIQISNPNQAGPAAGVIPGNPDTCELPEQ